MNEKSFAPGHDPGYDHDPDHHPDHTLSAHGERLEHIGDIVLNWEYWDCNCERNFIHPIAHEKCKVCGFVRDECPASRQCEVLYYVHGEDVDFGGGV